MSQKPETRFRAKVQRLLDLLPNSWFESIQQRTIQGTPDILGCVNGFFVALELKATPSSAITKLQELKIRRISDASGVAYVLHPDNLDSTINLLRHLAQENYAGTTEVAMG